ncbi:MAG: hypothetical protein PHO74_04600 [Weeksellaceae bacterium]|nr:hypothetical protein [Weeksellaceae bacterium]
MEHQISGNENSVYCATLLFAWDEIRNQIHSPLTISNEYSDLILLNDSQSFIGVLKPDEYNASGEVDGDMIKARAEFSKSLPFEIKLKNFEGGLSFKDQKVSAFGVNGFDESEMLRAVRIVYYKDDNNFIIKLLPKDKEHEIILFKTDENFGSMAEMNQKIIELTEIGNSERQNERINWRYRWNYEDELIIPKFNFNIETDYSTLEGTHFSADNQIFTIEKAWQRTAFILDESGAEIESEAAMDAVAEATEEETEEPKPKKMIFDKDFLLLLKRTDAEQPYFGLWTTNTELMIKN